MSGSLRSPPAGGGGSEALGRGVGGVVPPHPPPPIGDAWKYQYETQYTYVELGADLDWTKIRS